jgi:type IV pilus assembly protein PilE
VRTYTGSEVKRLGGFTLIELMVAVAVLAIVTAVAYPSYLNQVQKTNRSQAKQRLSQAAQLLERFYSDNNTYYVDVAGGKAVASTTGSTAGGFSALMNVPGTVYSGSNNEAGSPYNITLSTPTQTSFTLTANAQGKQVNDTKCGNLTLNNVGLKGITGTGLVTDCW